MNTKIIRSHRRTLALQILPDHTLVVKAPALMPKIFIDRFIRDNSEWIEKRQKLIENRKVIKRQYSQGESFWFLGKEYKLKIGNYQEIGLQGENLRFPSFLQFRIQKELSSWYINQGRKTITEQVEKYAKEMGAKYISLTFSDTRSKWGSCTSDNRLFFSWRLVMAPLLVLNYVVVHELAHTKEKNHSRAFWSKVRLYNPSYRQQIKWLKEYGDSLFV
jgi:predicted metal-dependent hydrolase